MRVSTDYIRHAAKLTRKLSADAALGGPSPVADAEFYKTLAKALDEIVQGFEQLGQED